MWSLERLDGPSVAILLEVPEAPPDTLGHALVNGSVPKGYASRLTHLQDDAPLPLVAMAVEKAAANEGVTPEAVWCNVAKLAWLLAVQRQNLSFRGV